MKQLIQKMLKIHFAVPVTAIAWIISSAAYSAAANPPVAWSYKSISSITMASSDGDADTCPAGDVPVEITGGGNDNYGAYGLSEDLCLDPITAVFSGTYTIQHGSGNAFSGKFNGQFVPSGQILEVHATWRVIKGSGIFLNAIGAGTGKGGATIVNGAPGPGSLFLDGSLILPNY